MLTHCIITEIAPVNVYYLLTNGTIFILEIHSVSHIFRMPTPRPVVRIRIVVAFCTVITVAAICNRIFKILLCIRCMNR